MVCCVLFTSNVSCFIMKGITIKQRSLRHVGAEVLLEEELKAGDLGKHIYIYIHTHMYTHTCVYLSLYTYTYIYIYTCNVYIYIYIHIYYVYTHIFIHICICVHTYIYIYICIYIYIYIYNFERHRVAPLHDNAAPNHSEARIHAALKCQVLIGRHDLSSATCLIRPHLFSTA